MTTNDTGPAPVHTEALPLPVADRLVTEQQVAEMTGLEVSQVRLMLSGAIAIPPHLEGVLPAPAREISGYVWDPQDVVDLPARAAAARERLEEDRRAAAEEAAQVESAAAQHDADAAGRTRDIYAHQRNREAERELAADTFRVDESQIGAAREPSVVPKRMSWWRAILASFQHSRPTAQDAALPAPLADLRAATEGETVAGSASFDQIMRHASAQELPTLASAPLALGEDGLPIATPESNTRRFAASADRDALLTEKADHKAERARARADRAQMAKDARAERRAQKLARKQTQEFADAAELLDHSEPITDQIEIPQKPARMVRAEARAAAKTARIAAAVAAKPSAEKKISAADKKAARLAGVAEKKANVVASKEAKAARQAAYRGSLERWKEDVKVAKDAGLRAPKKPKSPKNDTSKPKPIDITNAIRAFATMLDNSPGELDSVQVMTYEYAGTQLGEAFRRIEHRISDQNATLVEAFAPERLFPIEVHNMLAVGAKTISPGEALRTAVKLMDASTDSKRKLLGEIMEPLSVGLASLAVLFATSWIVMPMFGTMYDSLEMELPPISSAIMVMSDVTVWILGIVLGSAALYGLWWAVRGRTSEKWRTTLDAYSLQMPMMGKANQAQATSQLVRVLSSYLSVGSPERDAIVDAAAATKNRAVRQHLLTVAELMIAGRATFASVFDSAHFPSMARNIVGIAERTGRISEAIAELTVVYEREVEVETQQAIARVSRLITGVSALIFTVVVTMVTIPPLEMFGATLNYGT